MDNTASTEAREDTCPSVASADQQAGSPSEDSSPSPNEDKFTDKDRATFLLKGFSRLYKHQEFVDVTLCVDGREFPCHKNVLAVSSPFFEAMFSTSMVESQQSKITLKELEGLTMELVLDYVYTGSVSLSEDTVQNLLSASNRFQLISLRRGCAEFMMNHITVSNCIGK